jgi:hypothetical protein
MTAAGPLRPSTSPDDEAPALHERAIDNLRFIRETMERAGAFTAISGWGIAAVGGAAVVATFVTLQRRTAEWWLGTWIVAAAFSVLVSFFATMAKANRSGTSLFSGPARKLALAFAPPVVVGALMTLVMVRTGQYDLLPGLWMLLYGAAVVAGGAHSVRIVPVMGFSFMALGAVALFTPPEVKDWLMAAGFGGLHILFGVRIAWRHGG